VPLLYWGDGTGVKSVPSGVDVTGAGVVAVGAGGSSEGGFLVGGADGVTTIVGEGVEVTTGAVEVALGTADAVGVALGSNTIKGGKTTLTFEFALGVRNVSNQLSGVRISGKIGWIKPACNFEAESRFKLDCIPACTLQFGTMRTAIWPAIIIRKMPIGTMTIRRLQSRFSRFVIFTILSPSFFLQAGKQRIYCLDVFLHYTPGFPPKSARHALPQFHAQ